MYIFSILDTQEGHVLFDILNNLNGLYLYFEMLDDGLEIFDGFKVFDNGFKILILKFLTVLKYLTILNCLC